MDFERDITCTECGHLNKMSQFLCDKCGRYLPHINVGVQTERIDTGELASAQQYDDVEDLPETGHLPSSIYLEDVDDPNQFLMVSYRIGYLNVGRSHTATNIHPDFDLSVFDAQNHGVSRLHARFRCTSNAVYIQDLNSINGTHYDGKRLLPSAYVEVETGKIVGFGTLLLRLVFKVR